MLIETDLLEIAQDYVNNISKKANIELIMPHEVSIVKSYGTIFYYTSKKFCETRDDRYIIAGNAPFLVEIKTGNIIVFGTARNIDYYVKEYEASRWPDNRKVD